jgi:acetyl-CoA synthetase
LANVLKELGVKKGDTVAIYMPMIPETIIAFLAVIRLGALHSVVFAGFSSESLRDRVNDGDSRVVLTTDEGRRGGKSIGTKKIVDDALKECPNVRNVLVFRRTGAEVPWTKGRDLWWHEEVVKQRPYCPPVVINAEDPLFLLYTSGSTGKPKGVMHTAGGYLVGAGATTKYVFDSHPGDKIGTAGDVGWITGHTYIIYGPLLLGLSTLVFEGTPAYPSFSRYWDIVDKHQLTHFYVAPTAIRLLKRAGDQHFHHDLSSLRVLGSVGEPIAPEVWKWYRKMVGNDRCAVVDVFPNSSLHLTIRRIGKQKLDVMSLLLLPTGLLLNLEAHHSRSLVLNQQLWIPHQVKNCTEMMSRVFFASNNPGLVLHVQSGGLTIDSWTFT